MKAPAREVVDLKRLYQDSAIVQIRVWALPATTPERPHGLKYSLFYGRSCTRIVGYDNEAGKGDHRHYGDREERYRFTSYEAMLSDFWRDVERDRAWQKREETADGRPDVES